MRHGLDANGCPPPRTQPAKPMTARPTLQAFLIGVFLHVLLLALSSWAGPLSLLFTWAWLVLTLPGALIDMTAEVLHPAGIAAGALVVVASLANGLAYAALAALWTRWVTRRPSA